MGNPHLGEEPPAKMIRALPSSEEFKQIINKLAHAVNDFAANTD
jgi:hypothetical protein